MFTMPVFRKLLSFLEEGRDMNVLVPCLSFYIDNFFF